MRLARGAFRRLERAWMGWRRGTRGGGVRRRVGRYILRIEMAELMLRRGIDSRRREERGRESVVVGLVL